MESKIFKKKYKRWNQEIIKNKIDKILKLKMIKKIKNN